MRLLVLSLVCSALLASSVGWAGLVGPMYQINVRGQLMHCGSFFGEPVAIYLDDRLDNVGIATRQINGQPVIVFNPVVTRRFSNLVAQWWFAHECAHHALPPAANSETAADCFAVRQMVAYRLIYDRRQLGAFVRELSHLPGSPMGHLPGPQRAERIIGCALN